LGLQASVVSIHGPPRLYIEPLKLLNFDFDADPDPASKNNADPCGSGYATLFAPLPMPPDVCRRIEEKRVRLILPPFKRMDFWFVVYIAHITRILC
jgi:hypothetical protein